MAKSEDKKPSKVSKNMALSTRAALLMSVSAVVPRTVAIVRDSLKNDPDK
jgi:hypothetical protein